MFLLLFFVIFFLLLLLSLKCRLPVLSIIQTNKFENVVTFIMTEDSYLEHFGIT